MVLIELHFFSFLICSFDKLRLDRVRQLGMVRFARWRLDVRDGHGAGSGRLCSEIDRLWLDRYLLLLHQPWRLRQAAAVDF